MKKQVDCPAYVNKQCVLESRECDYPFADLCPTNYVLFTKGLNDNRKIERPIVEQPEPLDGLVETDIIRLNRRDETGETKEREI